MPISDLAETLIHIWDTINHLNPVSTARKLLYWQVVSETQTVSEVEAGTGQIPYPAYWSSGVFDGEKDFYWGLGVWS